jgi:hypothetical protein
MAGPPAGHWTLPYLAICAMNALRRDWPLLLLWLIFSAFLTHASSAQVFSRGGWDPDDQLRLVQLRDFLSGQSWFDTTQYRMNMPEGAPMHWSRLIELPLAAIVLVLTPLLGAARAEMVAGIAVPLLCLGGIGLMMARIAERIGGRASGISAMLLTLIAPALLIQLRPMRIDHHGWQIFCAVAGLSTLFWDDRRKAGLALGAALAVWIHISLEGAPMTAAFFLWLGWRWISERGEGVRLFWTLCSFGVLSLALFFGTQPAGLSAPQYCDTIAPAHIWAIVAAVVILLPAIHLQPQARWMRLTAAALAGGVAVALLLWLAPQCTQGAFGDLDPIVREYWYAKINEGLPVWHQEPAVAMTLIAPLVAALAALGLAWRFVEDEHRSALVPLGFFLIYASLLSFLVFRTVSVATAFTIVPAALCLAAALQRYRTEPLLVRRLLLAVGALLLLTSGPVAGTIMARFGEQTNASDAKAEAKSDACETVASAKALAALPIGDIVAPFDIGPAILLTTQHRVLASSHHRNVKGMRDQIDIFRLPPSQSRAIIQRRGIDYIVACPGEGELVNYADKNPYGLWAALAKGQAPDWLEYRGKLGKGLIVWRVR